MEAAAGASSTTSPAAARERAACTASSISRVRAATSSVSPGSMRRTGTSGACRVSASVKGAGSRPSSTTPTRRSAAAATSGPRSAPLTSPPAIQTTRSAAWREAAAAAGVGGLGVVDEADAVDGGEVLGAVGAHAVGAQPVADGMGRDAVRAGERGRGEGVRSTCGPAPWGPRCARSARVASSAAELRRSGWKARSTRMPSMVPSSDRPGAPSEMPTARAPSTTSASSTRCRGGLIGGVVDAGGADALEDASLGAGVLLGAAVPVEVVGAHVQHHRGLAVQVLGPVQLEAGQLQCEHVEALGVQGPPRSRASPTFPQATARWPAARRIDSSMVTVVVLPFVPVMPSQAGPSAACMRRASSTSLHTGMPRAAAAGEQGLVGAPAGRGDDEVDLAVLGQGAGVLGAEAELRPEHLRGSGRARGSRGCPPRRRRARGRRAAWSGRRSRSRRRRSR